MLVNLLLRDLELLEPDLFLVNHPPLSEHLVPLLLLHPVDLPLELVPAALTEPLGLHHLSLYPTLLLLRTLQEVEQPLDQVEDGDHAEKEQEPVDYHPKGVEGLGIVAHQVGKRLGAVTIGHVIVGPDRLTVVQDSLETQPG